MSGGAIGSKNVRVLYLKAKKSAVLYFDYRVFNTDGAIDGIYRRIGRIGDHNS